MFILRQGLLYVRLVLSCFCPKDDLELSTLLSLPLGVIGTYGFLFFFYIQRFYIHIFFYSSAVYYRDSVD